MTTRTLTTMATAAVAATAALLAVVPPSQADTTATQTITVALGDLDASGSGAFTKFDPSLGTLTSITVTADVTMSFQSCLTNLSTQSASLPAGTVSGDAPITFQGGIVADAQGSLPVPATTLSANIGGPNTANRVDTCENWLDAGAAAAGPTPEPSDTSYLAGSAAPHFSRTVTDPAVLQQYTGSGTVPVSWTATSASTLGQPSEWRIIFLAHGTGTASIQYTYTRPAVPASQGATATLYGPFGTPAEASCTNATKVGNATPQVVNGSVKLPPVTAHTPGYYTWVVSTTGGISGAQTCGQTSVLVHRPFYRPVTIATGFDGVRSTGAADRAKPLVVSMPAAGIRAPVMTVGASHGAMQVPSNVHRVGWLKSSARIDDLIGTTILAGHVSDQHDRPGAFAHLKQAKAGDVITIGGHQFRVSRIFTQPRTKRLPKSLFTTVGPHRLALVTCTAEVFYGGGRFHYTRNLVVIADEV